MMHKFGRLMNGKKFSLLFLRALPQNLASSFVKIICLIAILQKRLYGLTV